MMELPSIWNIIISTIVFFLAVWYFRRVLDDNDIAKGTTRSLAIFVVAYLVSWGAGVVVDWLLKS